MPVKLKLPLARFSVPANVIVATSPPTAVPSPFSVTAKTSLLAVCDREIVALTLPSAVYFTRPFTLTLACDAAKTPTTKASTESATKKIAVLIFLFNILKPPSFIAHIMCVLIVFIYFTILI